jgi:non-specific serine/threonine protein kinase/serine/threonine-protein kinase
MMANELDARAAELARQTLQIDPARRTEFIRQACGDDPTLRTKVESLLASEAEVEASTITHSASIPDLEQRVGPYKLIRELGRGGMGVVYLAERDDASFHQRVAIKLVRRGMEYDEVIRRFRHERQILASLDHPNIARLLDGGTTEDGVPFFVMEYIEGEPMDDYCHDRNLSVAGRLKLFRAVCAAVHYAHQNLVIHRDLKPGNILITKEGVPKLLDFGIAKILDPESFDLTAARTATWARPMTPAYASPEQVRGLPLTTSSDVYSLGVILYELLTGQRPYEVRGTSHRDIEKIVCEVEPERPSLVRRETERKSEGEKERKRDGEMERRRENAIGAVSPSLSPSFSPSLSHSFSPSLCLSFSPSQLRGDLDNIVLMALRKEPQRRYASAEQLAEDIRRHQEGLPVIARPNTFSYIAAKFIRRNRAAVAAAALVLIALIGGVIATTWQARVARAERARAEKRFGDVRQLANSFLFEFHDAIEKLPGSTPARALVVKRALEYLDSLSREAVNDPNLQDELATAYEKVGDIQGNPYSANLGDTAGAIQNYRKALSIRESLANRGPQAMLKLASTHERLGETVDVMGDLPAAIESHRRALAIREAQSAPEARAGAARSYGYLGVCLTGLGKPDEAIDAYRKANAINREMLDADANDTAARRRFAVITYRTGNLRFFKGDFDGAIESYNEALAVFEDLARNPNDAQARRELSQLYSDLALTLSQKGDHQQALPLARKALDARQALADADPANSQARRDLAVAHMYLGQMLSQIRDAEGTKKAMTAAVAIFESLVLGSSPAGLWRTDLAQGYETTGNTSWNLAEADNISNARRKQLYREARGWYERALALYGELKRDAKLEARVSKKAEAMVSAIADCDRELAKY